MAGHHTCVLSSSTRCRTGSGLAPAFQIPTSPEPGMSAVKSQRACETAATILSRLVSSLADTRAVDRRLDRSSAVLASTFLSEKVPPLLRGPPQPIVL